MADGSICISISMSGVNAMVFELEFFVHANPQPIIPQDVPDR